MQIKRYSLSECLHVVKLILDKKIIALVLPECCFGFCKKADQCRVKTYQIHDPDVSQRGPPKQDHPVLEVALLRVQMCAEGQCHSYAENDCRE